jgi:TRAP-type C4-dicarboxylate transport system permease small subunit
MSDALGVLRRLLDGLYTLCGVVAALFLIAILLVILAQMAARWIGFAFPGSTEYAGYCMAGASFLALAYTLNHGAHIRVSLLLSRLAGGTRRAGELWCLAIGGGLAWYFAWYATKAVRVSRLINDISQGQDATPLWIPQLAMAIGTVVLAVALSDHFLRVLLGGEPQVGENVAAEARGE